MSNVGGISRFVTTWGRPADPVASGPYGLVNYQRWCELEVERLNQRGDHCRILAKDGRICIERT